MALDIGLRNFPEGTAAGAAAVVLAQPVLPDAVAFAAGAMIFAVAEELVPKAKRGSPDIAGMSLVVGFAVMITLDFALGVSASRLVGNGAEKCNGRASAIPRSSTRRALPLRS